MPSGLSEQHKYGLVERSVTGSLSLVYFLSVTTKMHILDVRHTGANRRSTSLAFRVSHVWRLSSRFVSGAKPRTSAYYSNCGVGLMAIIITRERKTTQHRHGSTSDQPNICIRTLTIAVLHHTECFSHKNLHSSTPCDDTYVAHNVQHVDDRSARFTRTHRSFSVRSNVRTHARTSRSACGN